MLLYGNTVNLSVSVVFIIVNTKNDVKTTCYYHFITEHGSIKILHDSAVPY